MTNNVIDFQKYRDKKIGEEHSIEFLDYWDEYCNSINYDLDTETFSYSFDVENIDKAAKEFFNNMNEALKSILNDPEK